MADIFTSRVFGNALNSSFRVTLREDDALVLDLISLTDRPVGAGSGLPPGSENFSLLFHGPEVRPLLQGTYPFEHPVLGAFDLFIVPVGRDAAGRYYEAIINRIPDHGVASNG